MTRILLLGGSTTFGFGVDDPYTIGSHMTRILGERYPDRSIEVVNLAFDGYDSYQLLERLRSDGLGLEPDIVIVNSGINDVRNAWFRDLHDGDRRTLLYMATLEQLREEQERGRPTVWTMAKHWLVSARLPGWLRGRLEGRAIRSASGALPEPPFHWDALDYFEGNLERIVDLAEGASAQVLLSTPPSALDVMFEPTDTPRAAYWIRDAGTTQLYRDSLSARMRSLARDMSEEGRQVAFVGHGRFSASAFLDDAHLTSEGNRRVARNLVAALEPWLQSRGGGVDPR